MVHLSEALSLNELASRDSVIHNLEGRIKLIAFLMIIVFTVVSTQLFVPIVMEILLLIIMFLSKTPLKTSIKRLSILIIFGGIIIIFQPFVQPGTVIWSYGWLHITDVGLNWGILLAARLIVSLTAIIILSSTSPLQEVVASLRKLKMPKDMAMILSIMVRFLFMFIDELESIRKAQKSRNFNIHSKLTPYKWRIKQVGYTIAMMFVKSYEQGERVYKSMISRGFSDQSELYLGKSTFRKNEYVFIISIICVMIAVEIILFKYSGQMGYIGQNISIN
ncbi:MAG: cobalt ECF transporter T component CbiQ [archaeon]|nr:cobalt ECF transporter T component CbiQ [archaeon]